MASEVIARGRGFSIETDGDVLRLSRARGGGLRLGVYISAGLAAVLMLNGGVQIAMSHAGAGVLLLVLGAVAGAAARAMARVRLPPRDIEIREGQVRGADGVVLASVGDVNLDTRIDWTDGMGGTRLARVLWLRWRGGRFPLYKSYDKRELETIRQRLAAFGLR
jgi:hypothetical protein